MKLYAVHGIFKVDLTNGFAFDFLYFSSVIQNISKPKQRIHLICLTILQIISHLQN